MDDQIHALATRLVRRLKEHGRKITVAESCTGGLLSSTLTDIVGASHWFEQSWVTYANSAKISELGVKHETLESRGAVSAQVAMEMARGALQRSGADLAISITGIAGPTNEGSTKPVGTVFVGIASKTWANAERTQIGGTRAENKIGFVYFALLTAIQCYDVAMEKAVQARKQEEMKLEEMIREEQERKIERERRDKELKEKAPWQDESWTDSEGNTKKPELVVEWSASEEE